MLDYSGEQTHVEDEFIKRDGLSLLRWALDDSHPSKPHVQTVINASIVMSKRINWSSNPDESIPRLFRSTRSHGYSGGPGLNRATVATTIVLDGVWQNTG
jgi:hypothetical protein